MPDEPMDLTLPVSAISANRINGSSNFDKSDSAGATRIADLQEQVSVELVGFVENFYLSVFKRRESPQDVRDV